MRSSTAARPPIPGEEVVSLTGSQNGEDPQWDEQKLEWLMWCLSRQLLSGGSLDTASKSGQCRSYREKNRGRATEQLSPSWFTCRACQPWDEVSTEGLEICLSEPDSFYGLLWNVGVCVCVHTCTCYTYVPLAIFLLEKSIKKFHSVSLALKGTKRKGFGNLSPTTSKRSNWGIILLGPVAWCHGQSKWVVPRGVIAEADRFRDIQSVVCFHLVFQNISS